MSEIVTVQLRKGSQSAFWIRMVIFGTFGPWVTMLLFGAVHAWWHQVPAVSFWQSFVLRMLLPGVFGGVEASILSDYEAKS